MSNNLNEIGIISEVGGDRARVAIGDMVTDFLPVFQPFANSFAVSFAWESRCLCCRYEASSMQA